MARIPDEELERLKREVSLARLIEAQGLALVRQGKDLACRCPWHEGDATPSCVITPASNLWHCFGCDAGGTVIDWVMRQHRVSFRHACELLASEHPALGAAHDTAMAAPPKLSQGKLRAAQSFSLQAGDQALLEQVIDFYHETLLASPEALAYLAKRGLSDPDLIRHFKLGYANRTLAYRLAPKQYKAGAELRAALQRIGILRDSGHEHLNGSIVVPLRDAEGRTVQAYGRKVLDNLRAGTPKHLYLAGPHRGVWNLAGLAGQTEIILCEALLDALTFWQAGYRHVTSCYGVHGLTEEIVETIKTCGAERVLIAFDRDEAGERGAESVASRLTAAGLACYRVRFPHGMDANEYALKVQPATKSLSVVIRGAEWLGQGAAPIMHDNASAVREPAQSASELASSLAASESILSAAPVPQAVSAPHAVSTPARVIPEGPAPAAMPTSEAVGAQREHRFTFADRGYRVRGLTTNLGLESLKVNLLVSRGERVHVDTLELYSARSRATFLAQAAAELDVAEEVLRADLGRVLLACETLQEQQLREAVQPAAPVAVTVSEGARAAALELLTAPDLIERIARDFAACGIVGESSNALVGYLAAISRKLDRPLALLIQSTSAAGKSSLLDAILRFVPEEERIVYSAMTGQSLFYMGELNLKHKLLAIAEEEGAQRASYALKLLQSEGELTIASTSKDVATGKLVTEQYRVEGPVMIALTTTAAEIDEELLNRCLVLAVDEGRAQTAAIHAAQRARRTLAGRLAKQARENLLTVHQNAQRLLAPVAIVNPYADRLTFLDDRTRTRRDHEKYLTLIDTITLLHQHQRPRRRAEQGGQTLEYIEVTLADIELANRLAHEVLGRTLDELPPQTRRLLGLVVEMVDQQCATHQTRRAQHRFSRREVREHTKWGDTQLKIHLARLAELEYLLVHRGGRGQSFEYELLFDGAAEQAARHVSGLIDIEALRYGAERSGSALQSSGSGRAPVGGRSGADRSGEVPLNPDPHSILSDLAAENETAHVTAMNGRIASYAPVSSASSLPLAAALGG
jgi:DNA primase